MTETPIAVKPEPTESMINNITHPYLYKTGLGFKNLIPMVHQYRESESIKNDKDYGELKKIFGGDIPYDWLQSYLKQQEKWDMFYVGCNPLRYKKVTDHLGQSLGSLAAHAYVINGHFYDKVLEMNFKSTPCIDMWYHGLSFNNNIYMSMENLAWQSVGYSNLEGHEVDYLPSIQSRYESNIINDNE